MKDIKKQNQQNIEELRSLIYSENKKVAAFVGSGAAVWLGFKSWLGVLVEMAKEYNWNKKNNKDKQTSDQGRAHRGDIFVGKPVYGMKYAGNHGGNDNNREKRP